MSRSALDETPSLAELLDVDGFREVCRSFSELYGIGIKLFDEAGTKLVDVRAADVNLAGYLFGIPATQALFTSMVRQLKSQPLPARPETVVFDDFCGLRYKLAPILHEGAVIGRVIFGPYAPPALRGPPETLRQHRDVDLKLVARFMNEIPAASEAQADTVLKHLRTTLDVIIHTSYKTLMTSRMHIASMGGAFDDLERANINLVAANEQLRDLDRLKSNFIATVSHELRTPLTSVIGYSEMLLEGMAGELKPEQREYVRTILEKGESLLTLIGQVLDLSRIESGNVLIVKHMVDPRQLIELALSDVLPQAKKRELQLRAEVAPDVSPIYCDADKIRRVLTNLVGNAVKFTPNKGSITVRAAVVEEAPAGETRFDMFEPERNRYLRLDVIDTGIGIPPDKLERVFDTFFQVDNSSTRQFGGTGLGLSIARNFVQAHRGRVQVQSTVGQGSTFTVLLPYVTDEQAARLTPIDGIETSVTH